MPLNSSITSVEEVAKSAGISALRPAQRRALERLLKGENLLLVWPTGSGKSLCYQLPALVREGLCVVVSPLIALMEDQTRKARALNWPMTTIHSKVAREDRRKRLEQVRSGQIKLLYVTPERFRQNEFREALQGLEISLLAIDEAHCISQWGHDFRPDYSRLGEIRRELGEPQVVALTATATREVQQDIVSQLRMGNADKAVLWEGVERPNLHLAAVEVDSEEEKFTHLLDWLQVKDEGSRVVYFTLISTLQRASEFLETKRVAHRVYHGDLNDSDRRRAQTEFLSGDSRILLATPAFGLGVDKADVRGVMHFEVPGSLEAYFQEVGRAGRDGQPARCQLLYRQEDLETQMRFIETLTPDPQFIRSLYDLLVNWQDRLKSLHVDDLREQLSFKNKHDFRVETALNFLDRWEVIRFPHRQLKNVELLRPLTDEDLNAELWKKRKLGMQKKLLNIVQWFRSEDCRKIGVYNYFGWDNQEPCGFCDRCDGET